MIDDISSCGRIFLSLAVAVKGSRTEPECVENGSAILHRFNMSKKNSPKPDMPPIFGDVDYLSNTQRESLWQLITDMTRADMTSLISMKDVANRLHMIFNLSINQKRRVLSRYRYVS